METEAAVQPAQVLYISHQQQFHLLSFQNQTRQVIWWTQSSLHPGCTSHTGSWTHVCCNEIIEVVYMRHLWLWSLQIPCLIFEHQNMTTQALLPLSGRRIPTLSPGASSFPHHRATLRLSEKFILLLILSAFITLCFGAFFFLPDSSKHKRFDLGLEDVLIPHIEPGKEGRHSSGQVIHGQGIHDEHRHRWEKTFAPQGAWNG